MIGENTHPNTTMHLVNKPGSLGKKLRATREALNLTEKEAATRLHLSTHIITIMEAEAFENGPPAIFLRGYIRSYAKLLQLDEAEINQAIEQLSIATSPQPVLTAATLNVSQNSTFQFQLPTRWMSYLIIAIFVTLVGMWWHSHARYRSDMEASTTTIPIQAPAQTETTVALNTPDTATPPAAPAPVTTAANTHPSTTQPAKPTEPNTDEQDSPQLSMATSEPGLEQASDENDNN